MGHRNTTAIESVATAGIKSVATAGIESVATAGIKSVATPWLDLIVVCGKCSKKLDGGFGDDGEDSLARALKHELRASGRRRAVRVLESKCLGLCPKGAVTVLPGRNPGAMLTIAAGVAASTVLETIIPQA